MNQRVAIVAGCALAGLWVQSASGQQISPAFQQRNVSLVGTLTDPSQSPASITDDTTIDALGFAPMNESIEPGFSWGAGTVAGLASQQSSITTTEVRASGRARMQVSAGAPGVNGQGIAMSNCQIDFVIDATGLYRVTLSMFQQRTASSDLRLFGPGHSLVVELLPFQFTSFDQQLLLTPGEYSLSATASASGFADFDIGANPLAAQSGYDAAVTLVPAPGAAGAAGLLVAWGACRRRVTNRC